MDSINQLIELYSSTKFNTVKRSLGDFGISRFEDHGRGVAGETRSGGLETPLRQPSQCGRKRESRSRPLSPENV